MVKHVAQSASRALGLLIAKCKTIGGVPYNVFTKLYDSVVWPVISYSSPIWGIRSYSYINAVHNRAMRFYLGVGRYTPNDAVAGEMAWRPTSVRQWKSVGLYWSKLAAIENSRLNKRISLWAYEKSGKSCKNWMFLVSEFLAANHFGQYSNITVAIPSSRRFVADFENKIYGDFVTNWSARINSNVGTSGRSRNKLRSYKT